MNQHAAIAGPGFCHSTSTSEAGPKFSVLFISGLLGALIPLSLALYWVAFLFAPEAVGSLLRIIVLGGSIGLAALWYRAPLSHAEVLLFRVFAVVAVLWLLPTLLATDPSHALSGWIKLLLLFVMCGFVTRGLRHPPTAHACGLALLAGGVILSILILFVHVKYVGFTLPTYKTSREFKGVLLTAGISLNSIAFEAVLSYLMGLCLVRPNRLINSIGVAVVIVSSFFSGSRAPLVVLCGSVVVLLCVAGLSAQQLVRRFAALLLLTTASLTSVVVISMASDADLNRATEGRSHLWPVAMQKFFERPLFGFGYESWRDDLVSRLPGERDLTFDLAQRMGGGYHNQYVSVLAEEGLIGAFAAALILWLLLRSTWLLAFRKWATLGSSKWSLFAAIFLLLRANFEVPGLFGYGQEPIDYLAYIFLAVVLSRFSIEEDYARASTAAPEARA